MKKDNIWINIICLISGCLISYISLQFSFFEIDLKINVVESLIAIITATIGLYIAIAIQKTHNRKQNLYFYLQPKIDNLWNVFMSYSEGIELKDTIEVAAVVKNTKDFTKQITQIKALFQIFNLNIVLIEAIDNEIDKLEETLVNSSSIKDNIIDLIPLKSEISLKIIQINKHLANLVKAINS